jgi:hypothetical protein
MDRLARCCFASLPLLFLAACDPMPTVRDAGTGGAKGYAHVGPTCPVVRDPPDPACADRAFSGAFVVESTRGSRVAYFASGADGRFVVELPPGEYRVRLRDAAVLPSLAPVPFAVNDGAWTALDLALDSGIR